MPIQNLNHSLLAGIKPQHKNKPLELTGDKSEKPDSTRESLIVNFPTDDKKLKTLTETVNFMIEENKKLTAELRVRDSEEYQQVQSAKVLLDRAKQHELEAKQKSDLADKLIEKAQQLEAEIKKNSLKKPLSNLPRVATLQKKK